MMALVGKKQGCVLAAGSAAGTHPHTLVTIYYFFFSGIISLP